MHVQICRSESLGYSCSLEIIYICRYASIVKEKCGDTQAQKRYRCTDTQSQKRCRCGGAQAVHWTQSARTQEICEAQCARTQGSSWKQCILIRSCYMGEAAYFSWNVLSYPCLSLLCSGSWSDVWFLVLSSDNSSDWLNVYTLMDEWIRFLMTHLYVIWWTRSGWWLTCICIDLVLG